MSVLHSSRKMADPSLKICIIKRKPQINYLYFPIRFKGKIEFKGISCTKGVLKNVIIPVCVHKICSI